ncbi:hypothetical protein SUGI_0830410 [Cryptomeria japonica]|nr:hypothetical protein SUGI_0830410 [Cryptomeria japonica]
MVWSVWFSNLCGLTLSFGTAFRTLKIGKLKCSLTPMIGSPYGTLFQVERGPKGPYLSRISASSKVQTLQEDEAEKDHEKKDNKDNRALVDNNTAQKLSAEDISVMRSEGISGDRIVEALIENSSTFQNKTAFSQEKYRRKKQKKYSPRVLLRRPFARSICEAYFSKCPAKIGFLRLDTLSLLLSLANVGANSDVLVFDMVGGLITGAVAERLGGNGFVCNTYNDLRPPPMDIVGIFNFDESTSSRIVRVPMLELVSAHKKHMEQLMSKIECDPGIMEASNMDANLSPKDSLSKDMLSIVPKSCSDKGSEQEEIPLETFLSECKTSHGMHAEQNECNMQELEISEIDLQPNDLSKKNCKQEIGSGVSPKVNKTVKAGRQATSEDTLSWAENGFTSLIVAAPDFDPWTVVKQTLPLLSFSAPFVIYYQYLQPLAECMNKLQVERMAVALQISEPWLREYQVLPSRTHPHMQMSSSGGYILSGIRICSSENQQAANS